MLCLELNERHRRLLLIWLAVWACGAIALPMLPIWQGGLRILAGLALVFCLIGTHVRRTLLVFLTALLLAASFAWIQNFIREPFGHVIHALTDVFGHPLGIVPDSMLLLYDLICVAGLGVLLVRSAFLQDRLKSIFAACAALFWLWSLLALVKTVLVGEDTSHLAQMMTGLSGWATWVYWALLPLVLVKDGADIEKLLGGVGFGAVFVGAIVALQWMVGDYSYVLDASDFSDYFYRVRGTDYYHASATFSLALGSMALLSIMRAGNQRTGWLISGTMMLIGLVVLNNTRALSIAMSVGLAVLSLGLLRQKRFVMALAAIAVLAVVSSGVLYVKPVSGVPFTTGIPQDNAERVKTVDVKHVIEANSPRMALADSGLTMLAQKAWFGTGVGALELPLEGDSFNGMKTTYSTHVLYLDILLMAGIPALLLAITLFSLGGWRCMSHGIIRIDTFPAHRPLALLATLVIFAIGSLFLPQERNELVGIAFLFASLSILLPKMSAGAAQKPMKADYSPILHKGYYLIAFGVACWAVLTSPAYIFPVIEFVVRNGREVAEEKARVAVTEPAMEPLLKMLLRLRNVEMSDVYVLDDSPHNMPKDKTWILWSPARDSQYPLLRRLLGYQQHRQGGHAPSVGLNSNWWVVPSSQPIVIFLYVGARHDISVPLQEIASVTALSGAEPVISAIPGMGSTYTITEDHAEWQVDMKYAVPSPLWIDVLAKASGPGIHRTTSKIFSTGKAPSLAYHGGGSVGMEVDLKGRLYTWPNQANRADIMASDTIEETNVQYVADLNYGSGASWRSDKAASVVFNLGSGDMRPVGIYRMVGLNLRSVASAKNYSWSLYGSQQGTTWTLLDERINVELSLDPKLPSAFFLSRRQNFRYYRFYFLPNLKEQATTSGLMEIELYPVAQHAL